MLDSKYNGYDVHLIESVDELQMIRDLADPKVQVGIDTETTGLNFLKDRVVGVCISVGHGYSRGQYHGFYIPVRHQYYDHNLPVEVVMELTQWLVDNFKTCWFNRNYDFAMLEFDGFNAPFVGMTHDAQIMCHLATSEPFPALKASVKKYLNFDVLDFESNNAKDHNFATTDPRVSYVYGCFSPDTRFLTPNGFKTFDEVGDSAIAQWNPLTDKLEFVHPTAKFDHEDETVRYKGRSLDFIVSTNHRVYGRSNIKRKPTTRMASDWFGHNCGFKKSSGGVDYPAQNTICGYDATDFIKMVGFMLSDGSCTKNNSSWEISLIQANIEKKSIQNAYLEDLCGKFGFHKSSSIREGKSPMNRWRWTSKTVGQFIRDTCYVDDKKRVPEFVKRSSIEQRKAFIEAYALADGTTNRKGRNSWWIDVCSSKELADDIFELCVSVGYSCKLSYYPNATGTFSTGTYDYWRIHVNPAEWEYVQGSSWSRTGRSRVVCFSVPSSYLIVERQGNICISGNCQDPLVTVLLARHMWFNFPYIQKIYPVDNKSAEAMRRFSRDAVLPLDFSVLQREYDRVITELQSVKAQIFALTGYEFSLTSNTDKADALSRFVTLTEKTSNGKFAVSDGVLDRIDHPLARLFQKYAELEKFRGTYLTKMLEFPKEGIRINYSTCSVATGRLSSGAYKGNPYYAAFNIQNVPKVEVMRYVHTDATMGYIINDDPEGAICQMKVKGGLRDAFVCPEGYVWIAADYSAEEMCSCKGTLVETNEGIKKIEDLKPGDLILSPTGYETVELVKETKPKQRCCLELSTGEVYYCSPEQPILVARRKVEWVRFDKLRTDDYVVTKQNYGKVSNPTEGNIKSLTIGSSKEKMIDIQVSGSHAFYADGVVAHNCVMADMSGEPNLINPLLQGEDIHNYIAKQMFGFVDKHHRTRVKILNFSVNYGAGAFSIAQKLGISQNEGQELLDTYNRTLGALTRWKEEQKRKARKDGVIFTYFGRPRVMYSFYNSSDHKQHAFGDRTAVNSPVQGFGGDLIRIDHVKLMNKFLTDPEFADNVKYCLTVHDEIDLFVKPAYLYKCFKTLTGIMDFRPSNLKVPIVSSPSIGLHWGVQVEADDVTPNNHIKINLEKCEPLDGQTQEEMEQAIKEWESQENY